MSQNKSRYTITAALPYANGPLHIGHIAGAYLPADIFVRYLRLRGEDLVFICGSDEHGAAITLRAKKEGITPQEIIDKYHAINKQAFIDFGIDFDIYHRTSSDLHHATAQAFFKDLNNKGVFDVEKSEQFFDVDYEQFLADRYVTGTCPKCSSENAYGDQCEKCGSTLNPLELINPKSTLSGKTPVLKETSHWYLPMGKHSVWLREWIKNGELEGKKLHDPKEWKKNVLGQCLSWIEDGDGLQSRAMTRDLDWGVKVPLENAEGKVLYVWLDAPIGYISATKQWALDNNKEWEPYWKDSTTKLIHFIGKDNIVFHGIIFPILLKAHGDYILPTNVPANEFLNLEGDKISTSRNWAVWLHEYMRDLPGKQDELRYVLCSIAPETKDSEFIWKDYQARVNNELVAILGNFVNRCLVLADKYYGGKVPIQGNLNDSEKKLVDAIRKKKVLIALDIEDYEFRAALQNAMDIARLGNKYLADTEPWKLIKQDEERVKTILNLSIQICANLTIALEPFLPNTCKKLRTFLTIDALEWEQLGSVSLLKEGHQLNPFSLLFEKIEDEVIEKQITKLEETKKSRQHVQAIHKPMKQTITFDDFTKLDIRVGTILTAEKVEKADKLLKLTIDTGLDQRTVVSGIAEHYLPEEIIGKKVSVLLNLASRKIRGIESQGMVLMAESAEGKLTFVSPESAINSGGEIR